MAVKRFTKHDVKCWTIEASGWEHVREVLADLVDPYFHDIAERLRDHDWADRLDDALEALEILQRHTEDGFTWVLDDGGLHLRTRAEAMWSRKRGTINWKEMAIEYARAARGLRGNEQKQFNWLVFLGIYSVVVTIAAFSFYFYRVPVSSEIDLVDETGLGVFSSGSDTVPFTVLAGSLGYGIYLKPTGSIVLEINWNVEDSKRFYAGQPVRCEVDGLKLRCGSGLGQGKIKAVFLAPRGIR